MKLLHSFYIDSGELTGISTQESFTLGVEWEMVRTKALSNPEPFQQLIHSYNQFRIITLLREMGEKRSGCSRV